MLGLRGHVEAMLRPSIQGLNVPPEFYPHIMLGLRGHVEAMLRPSIQGLNIPPEFYPHIMLGCRGHVEAMLRPSTQGLNIPPEFYPHIMLGFRGHVEALPTLVIIILKGYACGPQHPRWPDATRQYYSPAPLPKSAPPRGGGQT